MMRNARSIAILVTLASTAVTDLSAQGSFGTLRGVVTDGSGAVVASAKVTLKEPATGVLVREIAADAQGAFEIPGLRAGTYALTCSAPGFAPFVADKIALLSGEVRRIDVNRMK